MKSETYIVVCTAMIVLIAVGISGAAPDGVLHVELIIKVPEIREGTRTGGVEIPVPRLCFDLDPPDHRCEQADCRNLPLPAGSIKSMIFDPPFLAGGGKKGKMCLRYSSFDSVTEMKAMYIESLQEFMRLLEPQGILVFKCQDSTHGRQQFFLHVEVCNMAVDRGFVPIDLFIKLNKTMMIPANYTNQHTARKMHSYFWIFRKPGRR